MCVFSGIQFTRYFIEFVVVETKQIVSSNLNVIHTAAKYEMADTHENFVLYYSTLLQTNVDTWGA